MKFAVRVCEQVKSNTIVMVQGTATVGIGPGQTSRVEAVKIAARRAGDRAENCVLASDAFFPFKDGLEQAAEAGASAIVQPGGPFGIKRSSTKPTLAASPCCSPAIACSDIEGHGHHALHGQVAHATSASEERVEALRFLGGSCPSLKWVAARRRPMFRCDALCLFPVPAADASACRSPTRAPPPHETVVVVSNRSDAHGLERAKRLDVPTVVVEHEVGGQRLTRSEHETNVLAALEAFDVELIVLSGYMRLLSSTFLERWPHRVVNIHPSLLPHFPGAHAHRMFWPPACPYRDARFTWWTKAWTLEPVWPNVQSPSFPMTPKRHSPPASRSKNTASIRRCSHGLHRDRFTSPATALKLRVLKIAWSIEICERFAVRRYVNAW